MHGVFGRVHSCRQQQRSNRDELFFERRRGFASVVRGADGPRVHAAAQQQAAYAPLQLGQEATHNSLRCSRAHSLLVLRRLQLLRGCGLGLRQSVRVEQRHRRLVGAVECSFQGSLLCFVNSRHRFYCHWRGRRASAGASLASLLAQCFCHMCFHAVVCSVQCIDCHRCGAWHQCAAGALHHSAPFRRTQCL